MDESVTPIEYNYKTLAEHEHGGHGVLLRPGDQPSEQPGHRAASCARARRCSTPTPRSPAAPRCSGGSYYCLDLTALGRQEEWEEPKGRSEDARAAQPDFATWRPSARDDAVGGLEVEVAVV